MPLTEAEELELLELEEEEYQAAQGTKKPWAKVGPVTIEKNPLDVDWVGAVKKEFTEMDPSARAALKNPLMGAFSPAASAGAAVAATRAGKGLVTAAERFATSPLPAKVAKATDVVGAGKNIGGAVARAITKSMPEGAAKKVLDVATELGGRKMAYSNPVTGIAQGVSDTARVVQGAQKGVAMALDKAPKVAARLAGPAKELATQGAKAATAMAAQGSLPAMANEPKGGPEKWARTGGEKLGLGSALTEKLMASKKGKRLLIEASDLSPSSARMKKIRSQIEKEWGALPPETTQRKGE